MLLFVCAVSLSILILAISIFKKNSTSIETEVFNEELEKFYEMYAEPSNVQLKQLVLAAKTFLKNFTKISKTKDIVSNLYDDRIVSDKYYKKIKHTEDELIIEKTLIENEADCIKAGFKATVFYEANKILSTDHSVNSRKKLFDEADFLKKMDLKRLNLIANAKKN